MDALFRACCDDSPNPIPCLVALDLFGSFGLGARKADLVDIALLPAAMAGRGDEHMYSYPNLIPLPATAIQRIRDTIEPYPFERLYGAWFERIVTHDAHAVVLRSADRYIQAVQSVLHATH